MEDNVTDENGRIALHEAAENGSEEMVELLLSSGANVNKPDNKGAETAWQMEKFKPDPELWPLMGPFDRLLRLNHLIFNLDVEHFYYFTVFLGFF